MSSTPLPDVVEAIADAWEAVTPGGRRPTFGYKRAAYKPTAEDPEDDAATLADREFVFEDPYPLEDESAAGISTVLRTYAVEATFGLETADLGNLARVREVTEHHHVIKRAVQAKTTWPRGCHEVVFDSGDNRRTQGGDTLLVVRLLVSVWET